MQRRTIVGLVVGAVAAALVIGASAVWPGLDARDTPPTDASVWALQTASGSHYARVNTAVGELDTVRNVANPSAIVQSSTGAYLFSDSYGHLTTIDGALPADLDEEALRAGAATPTGTTESATAGDYVAYRTDVGGVFGGRLSTGAATAVDPSPHKSEDTKGKDGGDETPAYAAAAVTVNDDGVLFAYSATDKSVLRYSIPDGRILGVDRVTAKVGDQPALTAIGENWFLFDADSGVLIRRDREQSIKVATVGSVLLARPAAKDAPDTYLADEGGLVRISADGSAAERIVGGTSTSLGHPARPATFDGSTYAAWLGTTAGTMWRSGHGEVELDYNGQTLDDTRRATFTGNGSTMILNETRSGWVWQVPDGALVLSSQDWSLDESKDVSQEVSDVEADVVLDPKPPVAEPDSFGVRAGTVAVLPVLLNDHDPNEDVLSIDPASVQLSDPEFGTVGIADDGGRLVVSVAPDASGSATVSYRVTDGTKADGLYSNVTTVTMTTVEPTENRAPEWCGVPGCLAPWPEPEVRTGGTISLPVQNGWVDPDGDPLLVLSASAPAGTGVATVTPTGAVVYQNAGTGAGTAQVVPIAVTVSDSRGATATKTLKVRVSPTPKLEADSFTVLDSVNADLTVDVLRHVRGTAGDVTVKSVQLIDSQDARPAVAASGTGIDFTSAKPGTYRVRYVVTDGTTEASATARITLLAADAPAQLATAPVVAFLRPQEDTTIDVLAAVSNPTRRVLLLSGVHSTTTEGSTLQVDTVGQQYLRVSGSTADGRPGALGVVDYTVSDGSTEGGASVSGQATVYLLPAAQELAPIAVDDALVVRAGAQVDVPVLDNDVAPSGSSLTLDPSSITSPGDGLAFAAGSSLRLLAPSKPGSYTVPYSVYTSGAPSLSTDATVKLTVIGDEANRAPRPQMLEGRVLPGQTVTIPFDPYGVDPDGDAVTLERIETQPTRGTATISSDGDAIVYTSTPGSQGGQDSFTYRVTDAFGKSTVGVARVGVLEAQSNPSPVTFTDYVQVQAGSDSEVRVSPLENDIDPTNGKLTISKIVPNLQEKLDGDTPNPEYRAWADLIRSQTDTGVVIGAGANPGTMSFLYDVTSSSGNTGRGLIVVKVVRETVPDYPVVADTVLTTQTRDRFADGVDVLAGKVTWTGGDVGTLKLQPWAGASNVNVSGRKISGQVTARPQIVPFAVAGTLSDGTKITTYAFVRVPAADDATISLAPGVAAQRADEDGAVTFDLRPMMVMPRDGQLEISADTAASGARSAATCAPSGGTKLTYTAGSGAPWTDNCVVHVRLVGQEQWTIVSVPIAVKALTPVPTLRGASLTVSPGAEARYDLREMTSWQGAADWDTIRYAIDSPGGDFAVTESGGIVTARAADTASPGRETAVTVNVVSQEGVTPTQLILRVGAAPNALPRAGTTQKVCSVADGTSCEIPVLGAPGEVNPLPHTPLKLVDVTGSSQCAGVSFTVHGDAVVASWTGDSPGGSCTASFVLEDAQGRRTLGDRAGSAILDLQGYPRAPGGVAQSAFSDGSLTLRIDPGAARSSYPALTGFVVSSAGRTVTSCTADGVCPAISGANGDKKQFDVVAVNAVGSSRDSVSTVAWAYNPPRTPANMTSVALPTADGSGGLVRLTVSGIDTANTARLSITAPGAKTVDQPIGSGDDSVTLEYRVGSNTPVSVTATPVSRFDVPSGDGPNQSNGVGITRQANGIGKPVALTVAEPTVTPIDDRRSTVHLTVSADPGGTGADVLYAISAPDQKCGDPGANADAEFTVDNNRKYTFTVCATSVQDGKTFGTTETQVTVAVAGDESPPEGWTYTVNREPRGGDRWAEWRITDDPQGDVPEGYEAHVVWPNKKLFGEDPGISVYFSSSVIAGWKSQSGTVAAARSSAAYQARVTWDAQCTPGQKPSGQPDIADGGMGAHVAISFDDATYYNDKNKKLTPTQDGVVPDGAVKVRGITVQISWPGGIPLDDYEKTFSANCG
ncbi:Ig-like domain-containing protein [Microbacterium gorillae]|uniref:Ig-like domain-containing protein n=1 Tax=Microbacterium gorillae TaxID=1231063 RepID=UPI000694994E|nr:Ig-like domain-containing protein [Microbacterium gorillae]